VAARYKTKRIAAWRIVAVCIAVHQSDVGKGVSGGGIGINGKTAS